MLKILRWLKCHNQNITHVNTIHRAIADSDLHPAAVAATMDLLKYKTGSVGTINRGKLTNAITKDLCRYVEYTDLGKYAFMIDELLSNLYIGDECPMYLYHRIAMAAKVKINE